MRRADLALIAAIALAANVAYLVASNGDYFYPDSFTYLAPAHALAQGLGFVEEPGTIETMRTPVYPLLLASLGRISWNPLLVLALQHALNVLLALAIYVLVMRRLGSRGIALTAALLFAIDAPSVHYANKVLTETTFTAMLFVVMVYTLTIAARPRLRDFLLLGAMLGILVLSRPVAIAYFAALAVFFAVTLRAHRVRFIAAFCAASLVLPIAWGVRNQRGTGIFTISSIAGVNMLMYRAAGALAMEDDDDFHEDLADYQEQLQAIANRKVVEGEEQPLGEVDHAVRASYYNELGTEILRQHPRGAILVTVRGLLVNAFDSDWDSIQIVSVIHSSIVQLVLDALTALTFFAALLGIVALWRADRPFAMLLALTIAYYLFMSAGGEAEARFRVPVMPMIAIAAAAGLAAARRASLTPPLPAR